MTVCAILFAQLNHLAILSLFAIAGGSYFFFVGFRILARKRVLLTTPTSRIRSAAMGLVEVNGMAAGPYTMPAPITGKPCFLYRTTVWQQGNDKEKESKKIVDETLHLPFFIDDSTGQLLIEPLGADLDLRRDFREEYLKSFFSSNLDNVPPRVSVFLARHGIVPSRSLRVEERLIKPDDALFIAGTLTENPGIQIRPVPGQGLPPSQLSEAPPPPLAEQQTATPEVIRLSHGPMPASTREMSQQARIAAALTRAGITKPQAWSAAGVPYPAIAVEERVVPSSTAQNVEKSSSPAHPGPNANNAPDSALTPPVILMKGANDSTFVISYRSQKEFLGSLGWKSAAMVWGGAAIILLGVYMLFLQMDLL